MKLRAVLTVLSCNLVSVLLISLDGFLTVRYAPWGRWVVDSSRMSPAELAMRYGDPAVLLHRGVLVDLWAVGPVIALLVGLTAGILNRRSDWRLSSLGAVVLIVISAAAVSMSSVLAALTYLVVAWLGMKLACLRRPIASR